MALFPKMLSSFSGHEGKIQRPLRPDPLGLPEANSLTSCYGWCCAWVGFALPSCPGPGPSGAMWPPSLALSESLESAWITSASSDGQEQVHLFLLQTGAVFLPPPVWLALRTAPTSPSAPGVVMLLKDVVLLFHVSSRSPKQHLWGLPSWGTAVQNSTPLLSGLPEHLEETV